ncbi:NADP-dependent oxidoreductase [Flocculibacter collagenilyticus]|uniref:NADP-dependent oxidoreductase n=1 Tax=Flocculibacter collagenilyticus TaxID=2744479 RepID=UPI0018F587A5|nr:NADP-dependent oxidoreductase [Flocculibacter collagenilyticus]
MQALQLTQYGDIDASLSFNTIAKPTITSSQVLVKVNASSINPVDYKVVNGNFKALIKLELPSGLGFDLSGEVVDVGSAVSNFNIGDQVFARVSEEQIGTLAEYAVVEHEHLALKPVALSHTEAASIPLVGLTSLQAMINIGKLKKGDKVLIHAGSGGIGSMAIQLAKAHGAYVATTTSTNNVEWVKQLGADRVIDYKKQNYIELINEFDLVYDTLGGEYTKDAFRVIKQGGRVVSIVGDLDPQTIDEFGVNWFISTLLKFKSRKIMKLAKNKSALYRMVIMRPNGEQLTKLGELYQDQIIKPIIDKVYSFSESKKALSYLATGRAKGKVVVNID